jgi:MFS family permease
MKMKFLNQNYFQFIESFFLGIAQILLWGCSYFVLSILADPIMKETNWSPQFIYGCLSISILISGLISPKIGRIINNSQKNYILFLSGIIMSLGLITISLSSGKIVYFVGWVLLGIAMGFGLYDALFASLGKKYGKKASGSIIQITLISGFATTVAWPILSYCSTNYGWRNSLLIFAILLIIFTLPVHFFSFAYQQHSKEKNEKKENKIIIQKINIVPDLKLSFYLLLINFSIGSFLMTGLYVYIIEILKDKGIGLKEAIAIGALLGPSQVGVRLLDLLFPKKTPIITALISSFAIFISFVLLLLSYKIAFIGVIIFGLGNGMRSILRGTLPLWIFSPKIYAKIIGNLALLPLVAQAATPFLGGLIIQYLGIKSFVYCLCFLAAFNLIPLFILQKVLRGYRINLKRYKTILLSKIHL